tara:strand:+ start:457 stop:1359 length:903 start_codon:yes stop_codon:yes gene_type:complete
MKRCALIGSTKIAEIHARELINNGINDLTVVSRNIKKSKKFSEKLGLKFNKKIKFLNHQNFKKKNFDIISICSNTKYHLDNLKIIKNKNAKIIVEKPLFQLKNFNDTNKVLNRIYKKYPNIFVSYPMIYLTNFFIKNFKVNENINSIYVYYQTRGNKLGLEIFFDLAPHVITVIIGLLKKKKLTINSVSSKINKKSVTINFKILNKKIKICLLELKSKKNSIFKFKINNSLIQRATKIENNVFFNYLIYKKEKKFLENPMKRVIETFIKKNKSSKEYQSNRNLTYELSYLTKYIYDQCVS